MDEFILGTDAALPLDLRLSVTGIWRDNEDIVGLVEPGTRYVPATFTNALTGEEVATYVPQSPGGTPLITNPAGFQYLDSEGDMIGTPEPDYKYRGVMVVCRRPYADCWQAQLSYVWSKTTGTVESNLSNAYVYFGLWPPFQFLPPALTNLKGDLGRSRRHELKAMISYQVPKAEVGINAYFRSLSGERYGPVQALGDYAAFLEPRGARELPRQNLLDLRIEKVFRRGEDRIGLFADITNAFNAGTVIRVAQFARAFDQPQELLNPRQIVLGARWSF